MLVNVVEVEAPSGLGVPSYQGAHLSFSTCQKSTKSNRSKVIAPETNCTQSDPLLPADLVITIVPVDFIEVEALTGLYVLIHQGAP